MYSLLIIPIRKFTFNIGNISAEVPSGLVDCWWGILAHIPSSAAE
jgi:hypothetical protein